MTDPDRIDANALYAQAQAAISAKDRATARRLLTTVVWADPLHEAGWLLLSTVAEDAAQSVECLRRVLALNPDNAKARHWLALAERAVARQAEPAVAPAVAVEAPAEVGFEALDPADQPVPRLGRYLLDYKFVTPEQLAAGLAAQSQSRQPRRLGDILLEQGVLSADRLQFALREQQRVRAGLANAAGADEPARRLQP